MNPLIQSAQKAQIRPENINNIKSYMQAIKVARNPSVALQTIAMQNPQVQQVIELCRGRNPQDVFMEKCQEMGCDPNEIINLLK